MDTRNDAWLDQIRIGSPCSERWEDMPGDERARACARCELTVYNLAGMTRDEATALLGGAQGRICARLVRRPDGTILTRDCPVGLARVRRRVALMAAGVVGVFAAAVGLVAAAVTGRKSNPWSPTAGWTERLPSPVRTVVQPFTPEPEEVLMGDVCMPSPPTPPAKQPGS